jgi:ubiquinone/menaquinone biosynthesis C-methylase UbiE
MSLRQIFYTLPPQMRLTLRRLWYLPYDLLHAKKHRAQLIPPKGEIYTGSGDFLNVGLRYLEYFKEYAGLRPEHHVLDVGSGIGRMAVALTGYLNADARYDGFDVVESGVRWCRKNISAAFPNFRFTYVDLSNDLYKARGQSADRFTLPYDAAQYDCAIVISVFTHMTADEVGRYIHELYRTLKPGGVVFATFFILNNTSRTLMRQQEFRFDYAADRCFLMHPKVKSANVAYDEHYLLESCSNAGFETVHLRYGKWSGRTDDTVDFQDILVLSKP